MNLLFVACLIVIVNVNTGKGRQPDQQEVYHKKLRDELFKNRNYDPYALPLKDHTKGLNVTIKLSLIQIVDLDIKKHILTVESWIHLFWKDEHLTWDKNEYGGIEILRVGANEIYKPDIVLYNAANYKEMKDSLIPTNALLYPNGGVLWITPVTFQLMCPVDLTNWPYDQHECFFKFGSWTHDGFIMDVHPYEKIEGLDLSDLWENPEWEIISHNVTRREKFYECCKEPYPDVTFYFKLKRNASLYHYTIFIAATTAILLGLIKFWFPLRSYLRFILPGFSLIMLTAMMLYVGIKLGFGSKGIPWALRQISSNILAIGCAMLWSTVAYNLSTCRCKMPSGIERMLDSVAKMCKQRRSGPESIRLSTEDEMSNQKEDGKVYNWELLTIVLDKIAFVIFFITVICLHL